MKVKKIAAKNNLIVTLEVLEKIEESLKRRIYPKWERKHVNILGKAQNSLYLSIHALIKKDVSINILEHADELDNSLINLLEKQYDFSLTSKAAAAFNTDTKTLKVRMWISKIREKNYHELGEGIDGYYIKMLQDARTLRSLLDETLNETDWVYAHDPDKKFSALDFNLEKLFKRGDTRFKENALYINIPTRDQLISLLVPSLFQTRTQMYDKYREWKLKHRVIETIHYCSPIASFLKFFMLKIYNLEWNQEHARWDAAHLEFQINKFLKLRLEWDQTEIYVNDKPFTKCKYLLLNIQTNDFSPYDEIKSIDDAEEKLDKRHEGDKSILSPEVEFWGHCSNLQAWYENEYDTRLLHRNIAFPLLRELADAGDQLARRRFKEEIVLRIERGSENVLYYLLENGYLSYLKKEEKEILLINAFQETNLELLRLLLLRKEFMNVRLDAWSFEANSPFYQKIEQFYLSKETRNIAKELLLQLKSMGNEEIAIIMLNALIKSIVKKGNRNHVNSLLNEIQYNYNGRITKEMIRELVIKLLEEGSDENISSVIYRNYLNYLSRKDLENLQPKSSSFLYKHPFVRQFLINRAHYSSIQISKIYKINALIKVDLRLSSRKVYTLEFYESSYFLGLIYFNSEIHLPHVAANDKKNFKKISRHSNRVHYYITPKMNAQRMIPIIPVRVHHFILEILGSEDIEIYYPKMHSYSRNNCIKYFNSRMKVGCEFTSEYIVYPSVKKEEKARSSKNKKKSYKKGLVSDPEKYKKLTDFFSSDKNTDFNRKILISSSQNQTTDKIEEER